MCFEDVCQSSVRIIDVLDNQRSTVYGNFFLLVTVLLFNKFLNINSRNIEVLMS